MLPKLMYDHVKIHAVRLSLESVTISIEIMVAVNILTASMCVHQFSLRIVSRLFVLYFSSRLIVKKFVPSPAPSQHDGE